MYEAITNAFPLFDCPLTFYSEFVLEFDEDAKSAEKARKKMARKASEAMARSKSKLGNKRRCIDFEKKVRQQETHTSELTTAPALAAAQKATKWTVGVGCRVQVADDLTPGMCSFGGTGYIQAFSGSDNSHRTFTVKYDEFEAGGTEHGIEYSRLTEVLLGARASARNVKRPTILTDVTNNPKAKQKPDKLHLLLAWSCSRNYSKGWRARDAGVADAKRSDRFRSLFLQDVKELQGYLSAKPETTHYQEKRKSGGKFKKRSNLFDPLTKRYLCHAWGVGITAPKRMLPLTWPPKPATQNPILPVGVASKVLRLQRSITRRTVSMLKPSYVRRLQMIPSLRTRRLTNPERLNGKVKPRGCGVQVSRKRLKRFGMPRNAAILLLNLCRRITSLKPFVQIQNSHLMGLQKTLEVYSLAQQSATGSCPTSRTVCTHNGAYLYCQKHK